MSLAADLAVALVALVHVYVVLLEMVWWDTPRGRRAFRMTPEQSAATRVLAANQGLYNGFLVAGLVWGLATGRADVKAFFLACVLAAGLYGGATAGRQILVVQALPAAVGLVLLLAA